MFDLNSQNEEVPCAVCRPKFFASSVMIPARTTCYSGWTKAYGGSLASGNHNYDMPNDDYSAKIYGAEYNSPNTATPFRQHSRNEEVSCAVCRQTYAGSLTSGYYDHPATTEYVCMFENDEPVVGGADRDDNGVLFYGVKSYCGSLKCPPYEQDKFLVCVVCMKQKQVLCSKQIFAFVI
ncbi:uncharacterized protein [Argopecten irradians]|uniref:uncharacterized protein n=1 Tax=Argopecten irradians TaxID=31199 RepID=UPI00371BE304